jgi:hypothetical protein
MARKQIEINWTDFDKLCAMQCTVPEVASWFGCSEDTIKRAVKRKWRMTFEEYAGPKKLKGNISIRRVQFERAQAGDKTMLIWWGKQYLGQREKHDTELTGKDGGPVETIIRVVREPFVAPTHDDEDA